MGDIEIIIEQLRTGKKLATFEVSRSATIAQIKRQLERQNPKYYPDRQSYRLAEKSGSLKDEWVIGDNFGAGSKKGTLFFKDLGPQIGWTTVFLTEYAGPLFVYAFFYLRPSFIYGELAATPKAPVVNIAAACWAFHYGKRLLETVFVHRFSHATMPIMNIFKNSSYYWGFAALVSYFVNHPLYTPPSFGDMQVYSGLGLFAFAELGNLSIHLAFKNMRPAGSKVRKIPYPGGNPFTLLFNFVSCPNYTYEVLAWVGFTIMTQCLPAGLFAFFGFYQMSVWAIGKHRNYKKEFSNYPRGRKSILPFLL